MTARFNAPCSKCGSVNDAHTVPEEPELSPKNDDLSLCLYCGHVTAYVVMDGTLMGLRELTEEEATEVAADEAMQEMERTRQRVMAHRDRP